MGCDLIRPCGNIFIFTSLGFVQQSHSLFSSDDMRDADSWVSPNLGIDLAETSVCRSCVLLVSLNSSFLFEVSAAGEGVAGRSEFCVVSLLVRLEVSVRFTILSLSSVSR